MHMTPGSSVRVKYFLKSDSNYSEVKKKKQICIPETAGKYSVFIYVQFRAALKVNRNCISQPYAL